MKGLGKGIWLASGAAVGVFLFLLCAALWVGSPIQDLVMSVHGRFVDHPTHQLTEAQIESLNVLIRHHAVIPAEKLIEQIVNFYTNLINLLVALLAILGVVAYMYVRISSREAVLRQAEDYMESDRFKDVLSDQIGKKFGESLSMYASDYVERTEALEKKMANLQKKYSKMEKLLAEFDEEESEGGELTLNTQSDSEMDGR